VSFKNNILFLWALEQGFPKGRYEKLIK